MALSKKLFKAAAAGFVNTDNFKPHLYTGGAGNQIVTGVGFQSDLMLVKRRDSNDNFIAYDTVTNDSRFTNLNIADISYAYFTPNSDGFVVNGTGGAHNTGNLVAFCFKGGGSAVSNTDGTLTADVSANTAAGFSIVEFTNTSNTQTIGHGLDSKPELVIQKRIDSAGDWYVRTDIIDGSDDFLKLNETGGKVNNSNFGHNATTFNAWQGAGNYIAYCFHSVDGYQKVGTYTGDGGSSNAINLGFQPRWVMIKLSSHSGQNWYIMDDQRENTSVEKSLSANSSAAEESLSNHLDFTSTGFTLTKSSTAFNQSGYTYIYLAIA